MSLLVVGTVPMAPGEPCEGPVAFDGESLSVGGVAIPTCQGTGAMLLAALAAAESVGAPVPHAVLGRDIGRGDGTRAAYEALEGSAARRGARVVAFHYLQPVMALMRRAVGQLRNGSGPVLIADAGGMYAARGAGLAPRFELMTPDVGEVGFLADPKATHPAYVSRYLFGQPGFDAAELARLAWRRGGSSRVLLVKGATDRVCVQGEVVATVEEPDIPALEAVGGTGDTITGLCAGLMSGGMAAEEAAVLAARCNRLAAERIGVRPSDRASDLAAVFPEVLRDAARRTVFPCPPGRD